jgi:phenylacetic acid degradation operon negative regulatory protein
MGPGTTADDLPGVRPMTARSVLASTLLGTDPPTMPVHRLVRVGALFGLTEGTVRTALSRMVAAGEVTRSDDGRYSLAGALVERRARQEGGRAARTTDWSGRWRQAVVEPGGRTAPERAELRRAMERLRMGELRDGIWLRPDNLEPDRLPDAREVVAAQCRWFQVHPDDDGALAGDLWDLDGWSARASVLRRAMAGQVGRLEHGDTTALAPGFVLSAAVLRLFNADPLLPRELLPRRWPGDALRADYDRYDAAYRNVLGDWFRVTVAR